MTSPVGWLCTLTHGGYEAVLTQVGGGLLSLTHRGRDLVVPFDRESPRPFFRGSVLAPWPNRVADGQYAWAGRGHQLALTEPDRHNALHGLLCWAPFELAESTDTRARLHARIWPQQGYPYTVDVDVSYLLDDDGLHWQVTGTNVGGSAAPYGSSVHPYLVGGPGKVDDWTLLVPAGQVLEVDPERLLPTGVGPVPAELDFRTARAVGATSIDHAYTGLTGRRVELRAGDGTGVAVDFGAAPWLQVHTADRPEPAADRIGLAVEPMSCPPDAFNSRTDLAVLEPGDSHHLDLRISAL